MHREPEALVAAPVTPVTTAAATTVVTPPRPRITDKSSSRVAVVLIPGLFGFQEFGSGDYALAYFDRVQAYLQGVMGLPAECFVVHKPPPASSLANRVASLYERLERMLAQPSNAPETLLLVGHSTGGLDARLLCNRKFLWPGGPTDRSKLLSKIAHVVALSAPMHGTPLAEHLRGSQEAAVPALYLLSILAKRGNLDAGSRLLMLYTTLKLRISGKSSNERLLDFLGHMDLATARQVRDFLNNIIADHGLIHDLTPLAMAQLNARISGADTTRLDCFVTVSPPPSPVAAVEAALTGTALQFGLYTAGYQLSEPPSCVASAFPSGPWLASTAAATAAGGAAGGAAVGAAGGAAQGAASKALSKAALAALTGHGANDGVVPASSQTLRGVATGLVLADHLDVVGHFDSDEYHGTTVFKSGSGFTDQRFHATWDAVARALVRQLGRRAGAELHGSTKTEGMHVH